MRPVMLLVLVGCSDFSLHDLDKDSAPQPNIQATPGAMSVYSAEPTSTVFTISNDGDAALTVEQPVLVSEDYSRFTLLADGFPVTLGTGESAEATVTFLAVGDLSQGSLDIPSNDPDTPLLSLPLWGKVEVPVLEIEPVEHDYGSVGLGCDAAKSFTLRNTGSGTLLLDEAYLSSEAFRLGEPLAVEALEPMEATVVSVRFTPDAEVPYAALLTVESNDPRGPQTALVSGAGEDGVPCEALEELEEECEDGYWADYFNLPGDHPDVEAGAASFGAGDMPWFHDWYDELYFYARQLEPGLDFGTNFFPIPNQLPGDPYHFSVHVVAKIFVEEDMVVTFEMGSDDDGWAFIDGELEGDLAGLHGLEITTFDVPLSQGVHDVELYMAERHTSESAFWFRWLTPGVSVFACPEEDE